jgi:hypothetical protein
MDRRRNFRELECQSIFDTYSFAPEQLPWRARPPIQLPYYHSGCLIKVSQQVHVIHILAGESHST